MKNNPILIVLGEPNSIFSEILFKTYKKKIVQKFNRPLIVIGSEKLLESQMKYLNYSIKIKKINFVNIKSSRINNKCINIIDVDYNFKKIFSKISNNSNKYINNCFKIALKLLNEKSAFALINGPISKKHFLNKKYLGITEYLSKKTNSKNNPTMLIYNSKISVSPVTTHLPIKFVTKNLNKNKIINNVLEINKFYLKFLKKKPKFAVLGLNPHCETVSNYSEEEKIIKPAIIKIKKKNINISGPYSADTFFSNKNISKFDVVIGMYHDQVLAPIKTLFKFDAINITLGLPFIRISPDHGTNNQMLGKNISDPKSLISAINFIKRLNVN